EEVLFQLNSTAGQMADAVNSKLVDDTLTVSEMHQMYAIGELLIQFGTFTRIKEILKIGIDCEHYGDDGEYALRLYVSKPQRPYLKTVTPEYVETVRKVVATLLKMTEMTREYVKYWE